MARLSIKQKLSELKENIDEFEDHQIKFIKSLFIQSQVRPLSESQEEWVDIYFKMLEKIYSD